LRLRVGGREGDREVVRACSAANLPLVAARACSEMNCLDAWSAAKQCVSGASVGAKMANGVLGCSSGAPSRRGAAMRQEVKRCAAIRARSSALAGRMRSGRGPCGSSCRRITARGYSLGDEVEAWGRVDVRVAQLRQGRVVAAFYGPRVRVG